MRLHAPIVIRLSGRYGNRSVLKNPHAVVKYHAPASAAPTVLIVESKNHIRNVYLDPTGPRTIVVAQQAVSDKTNSQCNPVRLTGSIVQSSSPCLGRLDENIGRAADDEPRPANPCGSRKGSAGETGCCGKASKRQPKERPLDLSCKLLAKIRILCYRFICSPDRTRAGELAVRRKQRREFFNFFGRNSLKSPDSDELLT
jgi:hypothetical protein